MSQGCLDNILKSGTVSWDIETSGLDWKDERIATCQLCISGSQVFIVKTNENPPERLKTILGDSSVKKIFHHAAFDLRFMLHNWIVEPKNIACTKIAAKLLHPKNLDLHSLKGLIKHYFGVNISKNERTSNWFARDLTDDQIIYAANDVIYLEQLLPKLEKELYSKNLIEIALSCFEHIPTRVKLDVLGYDDVYKY
ncbi:MAG: hypothetical protein A2Z38_06115 [Planctomycetes bacterium RBG_19FT_COMBO_48_8]|nr:MAG: hypothetical protein A2Z38_06115 [Planctomycetes bacterium RBG_19FT_COMBO_48_8]